MHPALVAVVVPYRWLCTSEWPAIARRPDIITSTFRKDVAINHRNHHDLQEVFPRRTLGQCRLHNPHYVFLTHKNSSPSPKNKCS